MMNDKMNGKAGTPDSMPSVAETSYASSNDSAYDNNVPRALFAMYHEPYVVENMQKLTEEQGQEQVYGSEISITSSEATVVTWNLTRKSTSEEQNDDDDHSIIDNEENQQQTRHVEGRQQNNMLVEENQQTMFVAANQQPMPVDVDQPTMHVEEPEETQPSCNVNLTPKQLAEIFFAFEGARQMWPGGRNTESDENTTGPLPPPSPPPSKSESEKAAAPISSKRSKENEWKPRLESLEKECVALKKIIKVDSSNLFKLKRAIEAQRKLIAKRDFQLQNKHIDLQITGQRLEDMRKERDTFRERESDLLEAMEILKDEVDKLSRSQQLAIRELETEKKELNDPKTENQRFASQSVEHTVAIAEVRSRLQQKESENESLELEIAFLHGRIESQDQLVQREKELELTLQRKELENESLKREIESLNEGPKSQNEHIDQETGPVSQNDADYSENTPIEFNALLAGLSARLEAVERDRTRAEKMEHEEARTGSENDRTAFLISQDPDEIEVLLPRKDNNARSQDGSTKKEVPHQEHIWCCDAWSAISGDLD
jgi:hypothetical protein